MLSGIVERHENLEITVNGVAYPVRTGVKFLKGASDEWPHYQTIQEADIKVGDEVALHGPPKAELHTVRVIKAVADEEAVAEGEGTEKAQKPKKAHHARATHYAASHGHKRSH